MNTHTGSAINHLDNRATAGRAHGSQCTTLTRVPVSRVCRAGATAAAIGAVVLYGYGAAAGRARTT